MDDIEFAKGATPEIGRLYQAGKSFSVDTPIYALTYLRGLASAFCGYLDKEFSAVGLDAKIKSLDDRRLLKPAALRSLRTLQKTGNIAAHPEDFQFEEHDFHKLIAKALDAALDLIKHVYQLRHEEVPRYEIAAVESSALRDMCYLAMLENDVEAMSQAGSYFKEKADQLTKQKTPLRSDGYSIDAWPFIDQAMYWFKRGAEENHPNCMYQAGFYEVNRSDVDKQKKSDGERLISRAADADHVDALVYVAQGYIDGTGIFIEDFSVARELFEKAAKQGHPQALGQLGAMYAKGLGGKVDPEAAVQCTRVAAEAGFPQAQFNLFVFYHDGNVLPKNDTESLRWLTEAASQDHPGAVYNLACWIQAGRIPGRSKIDAITQFERLVRHGKYRTYRARAALCFAEITEALSPDFKSLVKAVNYLQICYETICKDDDPHSLRQDCLAISSRLIGRVRAHISHNGSDRETGVDDLMICTFFDKDGVPVVDRNARQQEIESTLESRGQHAKEQNTKYLYREACINPRRTAVDVKKTSRSSFQPSAPVLTREPGGEKLGRNDPCHCDSGKKFKHCHGR
ncbi:SEC-C metal-binding domain-containing protein [Pseudomonas sp. TSRC2-2]|uniref:tetratricopeptide repeat protein n=1 Tax=Pseudomonas sp. TSRC2-2 TaxID=2804571 RepID=UPI003CE8C713